MKCELDVITKKSSKGNDYTVVEIALDGCSQKLYTFDSQIVAYALTQKLKEYEKGVNK